MFGEFSQFVAAEKAQAAFDGADKAVRQGVVGFEGFGV